MSDTTPKNAEEAFGADALNTLLEQAARKSENSEMRGLHLEPGGVYRARDGETFIVLSINVGADGEIGLLIRMPSQPTAICVWERTVLLRDVAPLTRIDTPAFTTKNAEEAFGADAPPPRSEPARVSARNIEEAFGAPPTRSGRNAPRVSANNPVSANNSVSAKMPPVDQHDGQYDWRDFDAQFAPGRAERIAGAIMRHAPVAAIVFWAVAITLLAADYILEAAR